MTSSMPTRRLRISTGAIAMAAVSPGSTSERRWSVSVVPQPPTLNQCRSTANTMIRMMPKKNDGMPEPDEGEHPHGVVGGPVLAGGGQAGQRHGDHDAEHGRDGDQRRGHRQGRPDQRADRHLVVDRGARVAVRQPDQERPQLLVDRRVQAELTAELRDLLRAGVQAEHHARGVAGNEPQQQEGDDGHAQDDRDRGGEPPRRITEHGTARPAARRGRLGGRRRHRPG